MRSAIYPAAPAPISTHRSRSHQIASPVQPPADVRFDVILASSSGSRRRCASSRECHRTADCPPIAHVRRSLPTTVPAATPYLQPPWEPASRASGGATGMTTTRAKTTGFCTKTAMACSMAASTMPPWAATTRWKRSARTRRCREWWPRHPTTWSTFSRLRLRARRLAAVLRPPLRTPARARA
ncbi:hypothetical protein TOPH_02870 [Tolypocladium ophioglossoides CBS 100239]|uniref:Uncharacterized protein n=1 Tax=Tolypocladium ophioglossoides (strain CBS 100239) TaxID=1163406 RepID=A0A0L0NEV1_TOLOC|nr:hypothetical protein TOPH_02870 [Tolypocladium ophioglossoides CBS 100239]